MAKKSVDVQELRFVVETQKAIIEQLTATIQALTATLNSLQNPLLPYKSVAAPSPYQPVTPMPYIGDPVPSPYTAPFSNGTICSSTMQSEQNR